MQKQINRRFRTSRHGIEDDNWKLTRVDTPEEFSAFSSFCCGDDDLDEFISKDALAHKEALMVETYVLKEATADIPVAFISFCNDSIPLVHLQKKSKKAVPEGKRYPTLPAVKIARLGVRSEFQNNDIGTHIINMVKEFFVTDNRTGCRFLTVDANNEQPVLRFYGKNDFQCLRKQDESRPTRIMYLDLKRLSL